MAAALTGSSAMLSEGVHSLVDTANELLLLGERLSAQQALEAGIVNRVVATGRRMKVSEKLMWNARESA